MDKEILLQFKDFKTDKGSLVNHFRGNPVHAKTNNPLIISTNDVIKLIELYSSGRINYNSVIDWCDVVRFSDLFDYPDTESEQEAIAIVIDEIQGTEELNKTLTDLQIAKWLNLLKNN